MSLVIPVGFASAAFVFTSSTGTAPFVTTLGVDITAAGGDFVTVANDLKSRYAGNLSALHSNALTLDRVTLSIGQDGPGGSVDSDTPPSAMTGAGAAGPMAMAVIVRKVTNSLGRSGRGRMFLPGSAYETSVDPDGSVTPAYRATINTALQAFYDDLVNDIGINTPPVLLHGPTGPATPTPITNLVASDLVGWIRGRIR